MGASALWQCRDGHVWGMLHWILGDTGWLPSRPTAPVIAKSALETCLRSRHDLVAGWLHAAAAV